MKKQSFGNANKHQKTGPFLWPRLNILLMDNPSKEKEITAWIEKHDSSPLNKNRKINTSQIIRGQDEPNKPFPYSIEKELILTCDPHSATDCANSVQVDDILLREGVLEPGKKTQTYPDLVIVPVKGMLPQKYTPCATLKNIQRINDRKLRIVGHLETNPEVVLRPIRDCRTVHGQHRNNMVSAMIQELGLKRRHSCAGRGRKKGTRNGDFRRVLQNWKKQITKQHAA